MTFRIKIVNTKGTHYSARYVTRKEAERIMRNNIEADRRFNESEFVDEHGRKRKIKNHYTVVKG